MKNKTKIILVAAIVIIAGGLIYQASLNNNLQDNENSSAAVTFKDNLNKTNSVDIEFNKEQAILNGLGYEDLELKQVRSASGARYQSEDSEVVAWNKGDEITIYENDESIFVGTKDNLEEGVFNVDINSNLVGKTWVWKETIMSNDEKVVPKNPKAFTITFKEDGSVSGSTDCNSFGGSYELSDNKIEFSPFAMTKMYCEGSQEQEFVDLVKESNTVQFNNENNLVLLLPFDSGSIIFSEE
ncbi:MAG TPA: META domain-containing protein [Patescibacteria group bacterium]|nr:META domain-containing protein [Patescibacteria group bacterium]